MRFFGFGKKRSSTAPDQTVPQSTPERNVGPTTSPGREIVVYGTADGSRCRQVRALLAKSGYAYKDVSVDDDLSTRSWLHRTTGDDALPKVFIGTKCYGGFEDIRVLAFDGRLDRIVRGDDAQDHEENDAAVLKQEMSAASIITLLRKGQILTIQEGEMETDTWAEALANPPLVYYEGSPHPLTELERIAEHIVVRLRNGEIEARWKEED